MLWHNTLLVFLLFSGKTVADVTSTGYSYTNNPLTLTTITHSTKEDQNATKASEIGVNVSIVSTAMSDTNPTTSSPILLESDLECSGRCDNLSAVCYNCNTSNNCTYGGTVDFPCQVKDRFQCTGDRNVVRKFKCIYCYLLQPNVDYTCEQTNTTCNVAATPPERVKMSCTTKENVFCLGQRNFSKMTICNWTSGFKWSTSLILSITLGGFGADRFYLGYWQEGLGKLFSFGGLGVWTLIDIVLIATSYLGPSDGSIYIY